MEGLEFVFLEYLLQFFFVLCTPYIKNFLHYSIELVSLGYYLKFLESAECTFEGGTSIVKFRAFGAVFTSLFDEREPPASVEVANPW